MSSASTQHIQFRALNFPSFPNGTSGITNPTLSTPPNTATDIWRKPALPLPPPSKGKTAPINDFNAPILYKPISLSNFQRMRVTVSIPVPGSKKEFNLFDQGGLVFISPSMVAELDGSDGGNEPGKGKGQWVKTGLEFFEGEMKIGTVSAVKGGAGADWSLLDLKNGGAEVTIEMERREKDETLWVYVIEKDDGQEKRKGIREVTWGLVDDDDDKSKQCWAGIYAARPTINAGEYEEEGLKVEFRDFELEVKE